MRICLLLLISILSVNALEIGPNYEKICDGKSCVTTIYSYQKYYEESGEIVFLEDNFDIENCLGYDYCVDKNLYQFYLYSSQPSVMYSVGGKSWSFSLNNAFSNSDFSYNLVIENNVATYENILPNIDLEYVYLPHQVKETLIIKEPIPIDSLNNTLQTISFLVDDKYSYEFINEFVEILDENTQIGVIEPLVVYDGNHNLINTYEYDLLSNENGLFLETTLDFEDFNNVVYPLYIDPSITINKTGEYDLNAIKTTDSGPPPFSSCNSNDGTRLALGLQKTTGGTQRDSNRIDIAFDISSIPDNAAIQQVNLSLYVTQEGSVENHNMTIRDMNTDNSTFQICASYHFDMGNGTIFNESVQTSGAGTRHNFVFNQEGMDDLESELSTETYYNFGIHVSEDNINPINATNWIYAPEQHEDESKRPILFVIYDDAANETEGDDAIVTGTLNKLPNSIIHDTQQVYIRLSNGTQQLGTFDKFVINNSQRWAFNYITTGESYTSMNNITPSFYVLEMIDLNTANIIQVVEDFIDETL